MKKYDLSALITISISATVEANSLAEAIEKAQNFSVEEEPYSQTEDEVWYYSDMDGEPHKIRGQE